MKNKEENKEILKGNHEKNALYYKLPHLVADLVYFLGKCLNDFIEKDIEYSKEYNDCVYGKKFAIEYEELQRRIKSNIMHPDLVNPDLAKGNDNIEDIKNIKNIKNINKNFLEFLELPNPYDNEFKSKISKKLDSFIEFFNNIDDNPSCFLSEYENKIDLYINMTKSIPLPENVKVENSEQHDDSYNINSEKNKETYYKEFRTYFKKFIKKVSDIANRDINNPKKIIDNINNIDLNLNNYYDKSK